MASARTRVWLSWSSGKDSAFALDVLRADDRFDVCGLLTTVNATHRRVAIHGVREDLLVAQAAAVGVPLVRVDIPHPCTNEKYDTRLALALARAHADGVTGVAFGDLFLADVRAYRERQLAAAGLATHFPLWGRATRVLAHEMVAAGVRARLVCIDPRRCPGELAGAEFDAALLARLPDDVDPCGENGEFHTFAYDGPGFVRAVGVIAGEVVERDGFVFADLLAAEPE